MKIMFNKAKINFLAILTMVAVLTTSCRKENEVLPVTQTGDANIKITNTVLGSVAQDLYQGDLKLSTTAIAYGESSPYLKLKAGASFIYLKDANSANVKATENIGLTTNASYSAFYYSNGSGAGVITGYQDDNTAPATGKVKVRFVNLGVAFNNTINVSYTGGSSIFNGLAFDKPSAYTSIDANSSLDVTVLGSANTLNIPGANFVSGKIYTVWFDAANSTTAKFHFVTQN